MICFCFRLDPLAAGLEDEGGQIAEDDGRGETGRGGADPARQGFEDAFTGALHRALGEEIAEAREGTVAPAPAKSTRYS